MWAQLLGSGCSAGFPAWNEGSEAACRARANDPSVPFRAPAALAVSADGQEYSILEAPLPLATALARWPRFAPRPGSRATPIASLVLTAGELGASAGVLGLATTLSIRVLSPNGLRNTFLKEDASFRSLEPVWTGLPWDRSFSLDREGILEARLFPLRGPAPDHLKESSPAVGRSRCGVRITDQRSGSRLVWAPRVSTLDSACLAELREADLRFVDGTCYALSELRAANPGLRDPALAGHVPIDGSNGSLALLSGMRGASYYVHLAGQNPACDQKSAESEVIRKAGVDVGSDGQEFEL